MMFAKYLRILLCLALVIAGVPAATPQGLPFPGPGFRTAGVTPIGTPASIGNNFSNVSGTTLTLTTTANIVAGDLVGFLITPFSSVTVSSVSDGTNTYAKAISDSQAGTPTSSELWYKGNASAVSSGATVTVNFSGAVTTKLISSFRVTGIVSAPLDSTASTKSASTTTPSVTSATLAQANELVIGTLSIAAAPTVTEDAAFTLLTNYNGGGGLTNHIAYKIVAATTAVTYAPTLSGASEEVALIATFKGN